MKHGECKKEKESKLIRLKKMANACRERERGGEIERDREREKKEKEERELFPLNTDSSKS